MYLSKQLLRSILFLAPIAISTIGPGLFKRPVIFGLFLLTVFSVIATKDKLNNLLRLLNESLPIILLFIWCLITVTWAIDKKKSYLDILWQIILFTYVAFYVVNFSSIVTARYIKTGLVVILTVQLLTVAYLDWINGNFYEIFIIFNAKTNLGTILACLISFFIFLRDKSKVLTLSIILIFFTLLMTGSKTSISSFVFIISIINLKKVFFECLSNRTILIIKKILCQFFSFLSVMFPILVTCYYRSIYIFIMNNVDDEFLTGRGMLWKEILYLSSDNLLIGNGYSSVWNVSAESLINWTKLAAISPEWVDKLVASDSGYIDILVSIGAVGLALVIYVYMDYLKTITKLDSGKYNRYKELSIYLFLYSMINNVTETTILFAANFTWFTFLFSYLLMKYLKVIKKHG